MASGFDGSYAMAAGHGGYAYNLGLTFYQVARANAERTALLYPQGEATSFGELNRLSNRIARGFLELGIGQGDVVCILNNKSAAALSSVIACLKIGATYTNLDVSSPLERLTKMVEVCRPSLILLDELDGRSKDELSALGSTLMEIASPEFEALVSGQRDEDLVETDNINGAEPAYIMFTSGSTGFPKGAVMSHGNVLNLIGWAQTTFSITPDDVFTNVNPIYFDNSVFDFYASLFSGATLCPITTKLTQEPRKLVQTVTRLKCTSWFSVPSLLVYLLTLRALGADDFGSMKRIIFGGEGFPKGKLKELYGLFAERAELINVYGPTECTCICSSYPISRDDVDDQSQLAPLGHMAPNFGYHIDPLDDSDADFGELLLYGPNVGLGYYNDKERTEQAFVQDPTDARCRRIMYRTGDLVERADNGYIHFRGRADNQIKHMGYRIELEEIEAAFSSLDYVDEVAVLYKKQADGMGQIVAFVCCSTDKPERDMLADVKRIVPPYMLPKRIEVMEALPKNANGKIDKTQLKEVV